MKCKRRREHRRRQRKARASLEVFKRSKGLNKHLTYLFITCDPMGLYDKEYNNIDEYDVEIYDIMSGLPDCQSGEDVLELIYRVFGDWFGDSQGSKDRYIDISKKVWDFLCGRKSEEHRDDGSIVDSSNQEVTYRVTFDRKSKTRTLSTARYLRKKRSDAEYQFLFFLRKNGERKILRQPVIGKCIVDFGLPFRNILIYIEREMHDAAISRSEARMRWLKCQGFNIITAAEERICNNPSDVLREIKCFAESEDNKAEFDRLVRMAMRHSYIKLTSS